MHASVISTWKTNLLNDKTSTNFNAMDPATYLKERVIDHLSYYELAANRAKKANNRTLMAIIVLGLLVQVMISIPGQWGSDPNIVDVTLAMKVIVTIMSLALAGLNGIANFKKFSDLWLSYRTTE